MICNQNDLMEQRLARELIRFQKNASMNSTGDQLIYYFPDESNIKIGYGLILGPEDTPYQGGFYIIKFEYPDNYPFSPPRCTYITGCPVRQNPNLYENGKVCMNILNTWGEHEWKATKGFEQVLLSIQAIVLVKNALDCEPPYDYSLRKTSEALAYDEIVKYCNFEYNTYSIDACISKLPTGIKTKILEFTTAYMTKHAKWYLETLSKLSQSEPTAAACKTYPSTRTPILMDYSKQLKKFADFIIGQDESLKSLAESYLPKKKKIAIVKRS